MTFQRKMNFIHQLIWKKKVDFDIVNNAVNESHDSQSR